MSTHHSETEDEGIVLHKKKLLKDDVLVIIVSRSSGKIALLAKGVRNFTSRRIASIQTGNIIRFAYSRASSGAHYLTHVTLISHLLTIKNDEQRLKLLYLLLFLFDQMIPENEPDPILYQFCKSHIIQVANSHTFHNSDVHRLVNSVLVKFGYGGKESLSDCYAYIEEIIGKKIPVGVL